MRPETSILKKWCGELWLFLCYYESLFFVWKTQAEMILEPHRIWGGRLQQAPAQAESLSLRQLKLRKLSGGERKIEWSHLAELCQKKKQWKIKNDGISVSDWIGIIIFSHWKNKYKMIPIFFLYMLLFFFFSPWLFKCLCICRRKDLRGPFSRQSHWVFSMIMYFVERPMYFLFFIFFSERAL